MTPENFDEIVEKAPEEFRELLGDLRDVAREAASQLVSDASDKDKPPKNLNIGFTLSIDLSVHPPSWKLKGSIPIRHTVEGSDYICKDPQQPELAIQ
jgi:hypothetical protein